MQEEKKQMTEKENSLEMRDQVNLSEEEDEQEKEKEEDITEKTVLADYFSEESDDEIISELLKSRKNYQEGETFSREKIEHIVNSFSVTEQKQFYEYFVNDEKDEKYKIPFFLCSDINKEYELQDIMSLLNHHKLSSQKKVLYRIYYLNNFRDTGNRKGVFHVSFFLSLVDYFILKIYEFLKKNRRVSELIENFKDILLHFSYEMKRELHLYVSFLLSLLYCKINGKIKINEFFQKRKRKLSNFIQENIGSREKEYDVVFYKRIINSVDFYNRVIRKCAEKKKIAEIHFAIIFFTLTIYPMKEHYPYSNNDEKENMEYSEMKKKHLFEINKQNIKNEKLLSKVSNIEDDSYLKVEKEHRFISYIVELTELIFFEFFYTNNAVLNQKNTDENICHVLKSDSYAHKDTLVKCINQIRQSFSYTCFDILEKKKGKTEIKCNGKEEEERKEEKKTVNHMNMFSDKKELKHSVVLLNLYNVIIENTGKITPSFFYLSFKILNTLLKLVITNKQEWDYATDDRYEKEEEMMLQVKKEESEGIEIDMTKEQQKEREMIEIKREKGKKEEIKKGVENEVEKRGEKEEKVVIEVEKEKEKKTKTEKYEKKECALFRTAFSILNTIISFLKMYIKKQVNIYIIVNHIIIPSINYLYMNFLQYVINYDIELNYKWLINELEEISIEEDITNKHFFISSKNSEKYFILLSRVYKLIMYSQSYEIKPVINRTVCEEAIPLLVPKYANNQNPKDILYMYNSKPEFVELKSLKRKLRQEKKLAYIELKKENNFLKGLKIKEEMERRKRNDEKYKRVKEMAIRDAAEYRKMKTTC